MYFRSEQLSLKFLILRRIGQSVQVANLNLCLCEESKVAIALRSYITFIFGKFFFITVCVLKSANVHYKRALRIFDVNFRDFFGS